MDDETAESTVHDIKRYSEALVLSLNEKKYSEILDYIKKIRENLDKLSLFAERKKVAF